MANMSGGTPAATNSANGQFNSVSGSAELTNVRRSWDFNPWEAGRRAVRRHAEALRRLSR